MKLFSTLVVLTVAVLTAAVLTAAQDPTPVYKSDLDRLQEQLKSWEQMIPTGRVGSMTLPAKIEWPSILAKLDDPPESLIQLFASAIPQTAFRSLLDPKGRSAIASDLKAGNTPDWFNNMPSVVKSYVSHVQVQATATDMPVNGKGGPTSTSTALAAKPTRVVAGGLAFAAGVLGLAVAL
ncbi:hypothetical protein ACJ72_01716 [Emergomyces africanus]|uniref:Uncharacterized protein n=1 Tax=Emergomyces africanus TaxID=1955775 RepID=A0A1B7P4H1_9EURO|nr:hypothetical protein ACJ72_01716 [Emergomyces africanus]